ncbi:MAG: baseplate assembly protein [Betaproteobacteria bacterium]|nr:baseplate assembly protein [Betaproteobacteria bacterium]
MMDRLSAAMRSQAQIAASGRAVKRIGIVDSYDPNTYAVKVRIQPEDKMTGWLPLLTPWVGNSWGLYAPPSVGDMIEVSFIEDDPDAGVAGQRFYNDVDHPLTCPSGEFWLQHKSGSFLKFHNDGSIEVHTAGDLNATVAGNATATVQGTAKVTANGGVTIDGAGAGNTKGIVQGDCICSFTGQPHAMISGNVKGSL